MSNQRAFTFVTYDKLPHLDDDDQLVLREMTRRGYNCQVAIWDDPQIDWRAAGICVLRSTWEYYLRPAEFLQWARAVAAATALHNDLRLVESNWHKRYLVEFAAAGLPVIPTEFVSARSAANLLEIMEKRGWSEAVVKPAVGAGTFGVKRIDRSAERLQIGQMHLDALVAGGDALVQQYMRSVTSEGERALIFFNRQFSHCVRKVPFHKSVEEGGHIGTEQAATASTDELEVAQRIIDHAIAYAALGGDKSAREPLYARVDLARGENGQPLLMELELIEPSLFMSLHPGSEQRFADALELELANS